MKWKMIILSVVFLLGSASLGFTEEEYSGVQVKETDFKWIQENQHFSRYAWKITFTSDQFIRSFEYQIKLLDEEGFEVHSHVERTYLAKDSETTVTGREMVDPEIAAQAKEYTVHIPIGMRE